MTSLFEQRFAEFSDDRKYRYSLSIVWDSMRPPLVVIGLNPSVADQWQDDHTIRRCKGFSRSFGGGGLIMLNIFAFVSTDRSVLTKIQDPVGPGNTLEFLKHKSGESMIVAAWGKDAAKVNPGRVKEVVQGIPKLYCLRLNADGSPEHPSRLPSALKPIEFNF